MQFYIYYICPLKPHSNEFGRSIFVLPGMLILTAWSVRAQQRPVLGTPVSQPASLAPARPVTQQAQERSRGGYENGARLTPSETNLRTTRPANQPVTAWIGHSSCASAKAGTGYQRLRKVDDHRAGTGALQDRAQEDICGRLYRLVRLVSSHGQHDVCFFFGGALPQQKNTTRSSSTRNRRAMFTSGTRPTSSRAMAAAGITSWLRFWLNNKLSYPDGGFSG
jgi:hypothetical protein